MLRFVTIVCCLALCQGHALPAAAYSHHVALPMAPYPLLHHGALEYQLARYLASHHLLKRSAHYAVTPLAVGGQRATSPIAPVVAVVKPAVAIAPLVNGFPIPLTAPLKHKSTLASPLHYGAVAPYASYYPYLSHY